MALKGQLEMDLSSIHIKALHKKSKGFITIATIIEDKFSQWHYKVDEIDTKKIVNGTNVYMSQNTYFKPSRRTENIKELTNCFIDIDCYKAKHTKESVIYNLEKDYFNSIIPRPNAIIDSGRGLYLQWNIEPVPSKALGLWYAIQRYFYNKLKDFGADAAALDPTRVLRIAGTINSKTGTQVSFIDQYSYTYTLRELQTYLPELKEKQAKKGTVRYMLNEYNLFYARLLDLVRICELRNWDMKGYRELICFLYRYWNCHYVKDTEEALRQTIEFNNQFIAPLMLREVTRATQSAERAFLSENKRYKYKNDTLIELLGITEQEQTQLGTIIGQAEKNSRRRQNRRNEQGLTSREQSKQDRIKTINELLSKGYKQSEISKELGVDKGLISRYVKEIKKS